jgi:hypothetical protein
MATFSCIFLMSAEFSAVMVRSASGKVRYIVKGGEITPPAHQKWSSGKSAILGSIFNSKSFSQIRNIKILSIKPHYVEHIFREAMRLKLYANY